MDSDHQILIAKMNLKTVERTGKKEEIDEGEIIGIEEIMMKCRLEGSIKGNSIVNVAVKVLKEISRKEK